MSEKIVVPALGESITEATVAKWLKNTGDSVDADEPIVELETDKVNLEVPSPITGVLTEINSKDGSVVEVGALLGSVSESGSGVKPSSKKNEKVKKVEIEPSENNVIKLDPIKKEPQVFEETSKIDEQTAKPLILTDDMIDNMQVGSVIYDLAAVQGGNTSVTEVDKIIEKNGVKIMGEANILNKLPTSASNLYAKNVYNFVTNLYDKENKKININLEDEIIAKTIIK